jgi:hypothetical protein
MRQAEIGKGTFSSNRRIGKGKEHTMDGHSQCFLGSVVIISRMEQPAQSACLEHLGSPFTRLVACDANSIQLRVYNGT